MLEISNCQRHSEEGNNKADYRGYTNQLLALSLTASRSRVGRLTTTLYPNRWLTFTHNFPRHRMLKGDSVSDTYV